MEVSVEVTTVFEKNYAAYEQGKDLIINQGGTRSGKTYSILQLLLQIAMNADKKMIISVVSRALPHLKLGAMRDFDTILESCGLIPDKLKNKTDNYYRIGQHGTIIEFFGADQKDKVHGPARDILFLNEANFVKYDIFEQLSVRTEDVIFLDYNPTQRFWVHDEVIPNNPHEFIKSTYLDNECLPEKIKARIESKRHNVNWWTVYGLGEIGKLEGTILPNWSYGEFDESLPCGYGLDFGFYPDPDAMVKIAIDEKRKKMYWDEKIYSNNNGTDDLIEEIRNCYEPGKLIIADSSEKRLINDLSKHFNIKRVIKNPGSVSENLKLMQDYEHIITENSFNLEKEFVNYLWNDKKSGVPIDDWNHLIDAGRYYFMNTHKKKKYAIYSI